MLANTLKLFAVAAGAGAAPEVSKLLASMEFGIWSSAIGSAIAGTVVYVVLESLLVRVPFNVGFFRGLLDRRAHVEGGWVQIKHGVHVRPYSFVRIHWNRDTQAWMLTGISMTPEGEIGARWHSTNLHVDLASLQLSYLFRAELYFGSAEQVVEGFGIITFFPNGRGALNSATGYFLDPSVADRGVTI